MRPYIFRLPEWLGSIPDWMPLLGGAQVGGRPIFSYGVMLALSFVFGAMLSYYMVDRLGADRRKTNQLFLTAAVGAILGARILYFIASAPEEFSLANFFKFYEGGLVAYGGFLGGILVSAVVALRTKADYWLGADCIAPAMALGTGITRTGCFLYGCDFGQPVDLAWSLQYPHWSNPTVAAWIPSGSPAFHQHFHGHVDSAAQVLSLGVHPTQLLSSLNGYVAFGLLMLALPYRKFKGQIMLMFLGYYGITRFLIELLRGDKIRGTSTLGLPLSTSQFVSLLIIVGVVPLWVWFSRREKGSLRNS